MIMNIRVYQEKNGSVFVFFFLGKYYQFGRLNLNRLKNDIKRRI